MVGWCLGQSVRTPALGPVYLPLGSVDMSLVAGIDCSTTATKVELRAAADGRLLGLGRAAHPVTGPPRSEQDPAEWLEAVAAALRTACQTAKIRPAAIRAVSVAAQQHGLVGVAGDGSVVRPAKLWNDTESADDARRLVESLGVETWAKAVGSVPTAAFTISKLAWLCKHESLHFDRIAKVLLPHDWLTWQISGAMVTDRGDASGTGYYSPTQGQWRIDMLALVDSTRDWAQALPEVLGPSEAAGTARSATSNSLGLSADCLVGPGTGDNMAAALGLGLTVGDVAVSVGTSGTVFAVSEVGTADTTGTVAGFADATGRFLPLVCTLNATKATDAMQRWLGVDRDHFETLVAGAPTGSGGVVFIPYLDGERTPNLPTARGSLIGLRPSTTREHLARATVEGVVCGLLEGLDALQALHVRCDRRLLITGGGGRAHSFCQVLADLAGRPVEVSPAPEAVARGACIQAAAVLTGQPTAEVAREWRGAGKVVEPDRRVDREATRAAYARAREAIIGLADPATQLPRP